MDIAARHAAAGEPEGLVVVANEQTAGRGRAGRTWHARPNDSLLLTVLLRPNLPVDRLGVLAPLAGVALAEAVEAETELKSWLKWPNDLWLGNRNAGCKAAGVLSIARLVDDRPEYVLVGIGVNIDGSTEELPAGATSIAEKLRGRLANPTQQNGSCGHLLDQRTAKADLRRSRAAANTGPGANKEQLRERLLAAVLAHLDYQYSAFVGSGGRPSLDRWTARAALLGESVSVEVGGESMRGVHAGIADDGALLLRRPNGVVLRVVAGDLTRGPRLVET
jgi:BirA family biotin operon repressor/biotin-[acetyl-CoA-carboxylase] ligase